MNFSSQNAWIVLFCYSASLNWSSKGDFILEISTLTKSSQDALIGFAHYSHICGFCSNVIIEIIECNNRINVNVK